MPTKIRLKFKPIPTLFCQFPGLFWYCVVFFGLVLGFPNLFFDAPFLVVLWPLGCSVLGLRSASRAESLRSGWLASFAGAAVVLYWLYMPVHYVGDLPLPLAFLCALAIAFVVSSQGGIFSLCAYAMRELPPLRLAVSLGLAWYFLEYSYAALVGFPWLSLSGGLALWPVLVQASDIIGAYGTASIWVCSVSLCFFAFYSSSGRQTKASWAAFWSGIFLCIAISSYGVFRLVEQVDLSRQTVESLFVEGNVDQNTKWDPVFQLDTLKLYMRLTRSGLDAAREAGIESPLIIWPETAMPFFYQSRPELSGIIRDFVKEIDSPLLFGAPGLETLPGTVEPVVFNRAFLLGPSGALLGYYDKEHLVPFGEYLPSWLKFGFLEALLQGVGVYHAGTHVEPLRYGALALGMLICYEGIFPWLAQSRVGDGANLLVDISNDGWFGDSPASRQHLYLTVPRCIEQGRWLMRATNTGISAVIDERGRIVLAGPQYKTGSLLARACLAENITIYHKFAPWLPGCAILLLLFFAWPMHAIKKTSLKRHVAPE